MMSSVGFLNDDSRIYDVQRWRAFGQKNERISPCITTHYIRDQDDVVVGFRAYQPGEMPRVDFVLPKGTTTITAYQHCNKHDAWIG